MDAIIFFFLGTAVGYWLRKRSLPNDIKSSEKKGLVQPPLQPEVTEVKEDPFLRSVRLDKQRTDTHIADETQKHEKELEKRFADDIKLKESLTNFAKDQRLDVTLCDIWSEIKHYPAWSPRSDFSKWNKLQITGISGSSHDDQQSVGFSHNNHMYKITERLWYGMESERYSDLTLFENSDEVFAISCTIFDKYDMDAYRCHGVTAFKMRGNWPQVLLENYAKMQIERQKLTDGIEFYRAEEIKSKFQT